jgi:hypothetical protein
VQLGRRRDQEISRLAELFKVSDASSPNVSRKPRANRVGDTPGSCDDQRSISAAFVALVFIVGVGEAVDRPSPASLTLWDCSEINCHP